MSLFSRKPTSAFFFDAPLEPDVPFYAIGDVHGCDMLLARLLVRLAEQTHPDAMLVCVGDYVDRGEQSAQVLQRLHRLSGEAGGNMICLKGNHEAMLLDFLDNPVESGPRWLRHGGLQTVASYGLPLVPRTAPDAEWRALRDRLRAALGEDIERWLRDLQFWWKTGNVAVVHAGADPRQPMDGQMPETLLWGHPDFERMARRDGVWIVHGHTIVSEAAPVRGRIPVDTGAYATGRLTAVLVEAGKLTVIGI